MWARYVCVSKWPIICRQITNNCLWIISHTNNLHPKVFSRYRIGESNNLSDASSCLWRWQLFTFHLTNSSVTSKNSPNVYKSCPKRISLVKWKILTPLQKLSKMCWRLCQNNCCPGLWKVAQSIIIAKSGHTESTSKS